MDGVGIKYFRKWPILLKTQLSAFSKREMGDPSALFELAARALNISAGLLAKSFLVLLDYADQSKSVSSCADVMIPTRLRQRKSSTDHPFRYIETKTES